MTEKSTSFNDKVPMPYDENSDIAEKHSGISGFVNVTLKVIISLLAIGIAILIVVFLCKVVGGIFGDGYKEVVADIESAMNGDFDSYWSLFPPDYIKNKATENGRFAVEYKSDVRADFKEYSKSLSKDGKYYSLEASKMKKLKASDIEDVNKKLIEEGISVRCTEAVSITLTVNSVSSSGEASEDLNDFIIGRIDGEWYPVNFGFMKIK